jgi:hypothetical protein
MQTVAVMGHEVDVLTIKNRPDKPFFVTADKDYRGQKIRAGVVYTRIGDTNVPLNESASEEAIELAWRERFGLGLSPMLRAFRLLEEPDKWQEIGGESYFYHQDFPEFTVCKGRPGRGREPLLLCREGVVRISARYLPCLPSDSPVQLAIAFQYKPCHPSYTFPIGRGGNQEAK